MTGDGEYVLQPDREPIPGNLQIAWFLKYAHLIPPRVRELATQRFRDNVYTYGDRVFRKLLTPEGEAMLLRDMDEEEADWWVYWLVSRVGWELAESYYEADITPSRATEMMRNQRRPEGW